MKKEIKITIGIICIFLLCLLAKCNITATKEPTLNNQKDKSITNLDIKSKLVDDVYKSLNMNLINNTCNNCLTNTHYSFMYYTDNKKLSDDEKLYIVFNELYKNEKYSYKQSEESRNENKIIIDKYAVSEELKNKFNINDMSEFDNTFVQSNSCGIKSYTYTKDAYELEINPCKDTYDYVLSKVVKAEKKGNHIYLYINKYDVKAKENDKILDYDDKNENIEKYKFDFKLDGDKYYLNMIKKIVD